MEGTMSKADDLQNRLINFSVSIILLCDKLPHHQGSSHIANQLARSGTAPPAHYAEARGAESDNDFIHKLKLCIKELNESQVWLKIIIGAKIIPQTDVPGVLAECIELSKIINTTISSTKRRINDEQQITNRK